MCVQPAVPSFHLDEAEFSGHPHALWPEGQPGTGLVLCPRHGAGGCWAVNGDTQSGVHVCVPHARVRVSVYAHACVRE